MSRSALSIPMFLAFCLAFALPASAQSSKSTPAQHAAVAPDQAISLAEQGHCKEAVPALKRVMAGPPSELSKKAGLLGLRCSLTLDNREAIVVFIQLLSKQFPGDPEVLYVLVHAYSDLSTRAAQDLGRTAPDSTPARKLSAEAWEMQGKWGDAQREYEFILQKDPNARGIHYLLARLYLSQPDAGAKATENAEQELLKELEIDPRNAGAHYILGELASRNSDWDESIRQFSKAAELDPNFAEAFLGWGFALVSVKRYQEAIAPLRVAERLTPLNPAVHYTLGTALVRAGQKEEAEKEFEVHRNLLAAAAPATGNQKPQ